MLPGDDLGWRPPSDLCKADTKVDVSFGGRELLSGVGEAGPCVTWCARFRCGSPLDRTGGRRRGSVRWGSGLAEKLIRTIAEKCLRKGRKGLGIKVAHCAPRKRATLEIVEPHVGQGGPRCVRHSIAPARAIVQQPVARILVRVGLGESAHI